MEIIGNIFKWIFFGLVPPEKPDEPLTAEQVLTYQRKKLRWRKGVHATLVVGSVAGALFVLWALGLLWDGGFSKAEAQALVNVDHDRRIAKVEGALDTIALSQLRGELRELRRLHCEAIKEANEGVPGARARVQHYYETMSELQEQYERQAKRPWAMPACGEQ